MPTFSDRAETIWDVVAERGGERLVLRPTWEKNQKRFHILAIGVAATVGLALWSRWGGGIPAAALAGVAGAAAVVLAATYFHRIELARVATPGGGGGAHVAVRGGRPFWASIPRRLPVGQGVGIVRTHAFRYRGSVVGWAWVYTLSAEPRFTVSIGHSARTEDPAHVPYDVRDAAGRLSRLFGVAWQVA